MSFAQKLELFINQGKNTKLRQVGAFHVSCDTDTY